MNFEILENSYNLNGKNLNSIRGIEALAETEAEYLVNALHGEKKAIKQHEVYFIDLRGYFGFCALVFKNGRHIYHADQFELHYKYMNGDRKKLYKKFVQILRGKLYTDRELRGPIKNYVEYTNKCYFLRNYYSMRFEYLSIFGIGEEAQRNFDEKRKIFTVYNENSFCYMLPENAADVKKQAELLQAVENSYKAFINDAENFKNAIIHELYNFEYMYSHSIAEPLAALGYSWNGLTNAQKMIVKAACHEVENAQDW